jgi:hypothetical protein
MEIIAALLFFSALLLAGYLLAARKQKPPVNPATPGTEDDARGVVAWLKSIRKW